MTTIEPTNTGYLVRWRDPDGRERFRECPTYSLAGVLKREVEDAIAHGERWQPRAVSTAPDLRVMIQAFLACCSTTLRPQTVVRYARALGLFVQWLEARHGAGQFLGPDLLCRQILAEWHGALAHGGLHGRDRKPSTRRKLIEVVQLLWRWAYDHDQYGDLVLPPRSLNLPREPATPTVAPTWDEMDSCVRALRSWQQRTCTVQRFTGLRVHQAMHLRWDDLDLDRGTLTVRGELGKTRWERQGRVVPLSPHLVEVLRTWEQPEDWVVTSNRRRGGAFARTARSRDAARGWKRAGVRPEVWRGRPHHAFRRGLVSGLKRAGADADAVEHLVGHALGSRGVYIDLDSLPLEEAVALIPPFDPATAAALAENDGVKPSFGGLVVLDGTLPVREITLDDVGRTPPGVYRPRPWTPQHGVDPRYLPPLAG